MFLALGDRGAIYVAGESSSLEFGMGARAGIAPHVVAADTVGEHPHKGGGIVGPSLAFVAVVSPLPTSMRLPLVPEGIPKSVTPTAAVRFSVHTAPRARVVVSFEADVCSYTAILPEFTQRCTRVYSMSSGGTADRGGVLPVLFHVRVPGSGRALGIVTIMVRLGSRTTTRDNVLILVAPQPSS